MIKKHYLLLIASAVWMIAGLNVFRIGVNLYLPFISPFNLFLSLLVFLFFIGAIFYRLTIKHTTRILSYSQDKQFFLKFFDLKSFILMATMMIGGSLIRVYHLLPNKFIAVFYSGLGAALFLAGIIFSYHYFKWKNQEEKE